MDAMAQFSEYMNELLASKTSHMITPFMSQYTFYMIISVIVCMVVVLIAAKKVKLIPSGIWTGGVEHLMDWLRRDVGYNVIGPDADRHMPFLMTIFFFILTANLIGLIPGVSTATGIIGTTFAIALISFIYFNYYGFKAQGWRYILSFAPKGVFFPMNIIVWVIELFSCFLRLITLAVRLFGNMYAGHLALGAFAILTSVFVMPLMQGFTLAAFAGALPGLLWLVFLILMYFMEFLVACIQAYVFTMLSSVYIQLAAYNEE